MPALSHEQRKKARDLRIKAQEEADRAAAKRLRGSIAARSSMQGATTKGETVGGAKPQAKPVPRTTPGAAAENNPKGVSDPNDKETQRMLSRKPKPAEKKPATPPVKATAQRTTAMSASRITPPIPKPKQETKAAAQSYRDPEDVKGTSVGRYRTLSEHLAAVQANKAMKIGSKMDTKSDVYTPSTKVDGSKMDTSKVTSKTQEYDKKKRKKVS